MLNIEERHTSISIELNVRELATRSVQIFWRLGNVSASRKEYVNGYD